MSTFRRIPRAWLFILGLAAILAGFGYGAYSYESLHRQNLALEDRLAGLEAERATLLGQLNDASTTLSQFASEIGSVTTTVGTLQKLADTDPELLKKYSKVYFLNENYVPKGLIDIDPALTYDGKQIEFLSQAYPFLSAMLADASSTGLDLLVESGYRSYGTQSSLKSAYSVTYGAGTANSFSADQGYSEHQLGTAVDFTTATLKGRLVISFDQTPEFKWLSENAYKYGFVLSYPPDNSYYIYEPWHWRFVGTALALRLHEERENFYSLEQRQIDPYLVTLFNPIGATAE